MHDIVERMKAMAAQVNGLFIPAGQVEDTLARFASPLLIWNNHETFKLSLVGSSTLVLHNGRYLMLVTQHQLRGIPDASSVSLLKDDGSIAVTSAGMRHGPLSTDTDAFDVVAFDFTEPVEAHPHFKRRFFDLASVAPDTMTSDIVSFLVVGYPSADQQYELEEKNHIGFARLRVLCQPDSQPSDDAVLTLKTIEPLDRSPDGMSGGPAFVVQVVQGEFKVFLAGIVLRAGRDHFHILKVGYLAALLGALEWK